MRQFQEPQSAKIRAAYHREQAIELERRGFPCFAQFHREMVLWLDPPVREVAREPRRKETVE